MQMLPITVFIHNIFNCSCWKNTYCIFKLKINSNNLGYSDFNKLKHLQIKLIFFFVETLSSCLILCNLSFN